VGRNNGVSEEKLIEIHDYEASDRFDEREKLALAYADKITLSTEDVDDDLFVRLAQRYSPEEIVELTFTISYENFLSKFHHALLIQSQGFCPVPVRTARQKR
jgi:alkylhydroperoxidase family enzyme